MAEGGSQWRRRRKPRGPAGKGSEEPSLARGTGPELKQELWRRGFGVEASVCRLCWQLDCAGQVGQKVGGRVTFGLQSWVKRWWSEGRQQPRRWRSLRVEGLDGAGVAGRVWCECGEMTGDWIESSQAGKSHNTLGDLVSPATARSPPGRRGNKSAAL